MFAQHLLILVLAQNVPIFPVPPPVEALQVQEKEQDYTVRQLARALKLVCDAAFDANRHVPQILDDQERGIIQSYCSVGERLAYRSGLVEELDLQLDSLIGYMQTSTRKYMRPYFTLIKELLANLRGL